MPRTSRPFVVLVTASLIGLSCSSLAVAQPDEKKAKPADRQRTQEEKDAGAAAGAGLGLASIACFGFFGVLGLAVYFAPTIIGLLRHHPNMAPILVVNIFLGWSIIGWVVALAWAFTTQEGRPRYRRRPSADDYD